MKLFKKLAAAALAAVLALSMVGCGNANSVNPTKQFVLNLIADSADQGGAEINNTAAMDGIAQNLLNKAAELYGSEEYAGEPVVALLKAASKTEGMGFEEGKTYLVSCAEDHQYKSSLMPNAYKQQFFFVKLMQGSFTVQLTQNGVTVQPGSRINTTKKADVGVAVGKIGDKTYAVVVMMPTETAAAPGTPDRD